MEARASSGTSIDIWPPSAPPSLAAVQYCLASCAAEPLVALHGGAAWVQRLAPCRAPPHRPAPAPPPGRHASVCHLSTALPLSLSMQHRHNLCSQAIGPALHTLKHCHVMMQGPQQLQYHGKQQARPSCREAPRGWACSMRAMRQQLGSSAWCCPPANPPCRRGSWLPWLPRARRCSWCGAAVRTRPAAHRLQGGCGSACRAPPSTRTQPEHPATICWLTSPPMSGTASSDPR